MSDTVPSSDTDLPRRRPWLRPLLVVLAVIFLWEAWLWEKTAPIVAWVLRLIPFEAIKHAVARWASRLPPYGALLFFLVPLILVEPINVAALWCFAHKNLVLGSFFLLMAKLVGVGLMAFVFEACRRQLLAIGWFAALHRWVIAAKDWAERQVAPYKVMVRTFMARLRQDAARVAQALGWRSGAGGATSLWRRVLDLRRKAFSRP